MTDINFEGTTEREANSVTRIQVPIVKFAAITEDAVIPKQAHSTDAGFDLSSTTRVDIPPGASLLVGTGLKMAIPEGWCGQINPRSGLASKSKIAIGARVIDSSYRGEVMINLINNGHDTFEVVKGLRVAQILFIPVLTLTETVSEDSLDETVRGTGGFGSSGDR